MSDINYEGCTIQDLQDVLSQIDRSKFPQRYEAAKSALDRKLKEDVQDEEFQDFKEETRKEFKPSKKLLYIGTIFAVGILIYSLYFGRLPPIRNLDFSVDKDPAFYWIFLVGMVFTCIYNIYRIRNFREN